MKEIYFVHDELKHNSFIQKTRQEIIFLKTEIFLINENHCMGFSILFVPHFIYAGTVPRGWRDLSFLVQKKAVWWERVHLCACVWIYMCYLCKMSNRSSSERTLFRYPSCRAKYWQIKSVISLVYMRMYMFMSLCAWCTCLWFVLLKCSIPSFCFQGLTDPEEFVIVKVIEVMTSLTESGLLQKSSLYDLLSDVACYLVHPDLWIRQVPLGAWTCGFPVFNNNWLFLALQKVFYY